MDIIAPMFNVTRHVINAYALMSRPMGHLAIACRAKSELTQLTSNICKDGCPAVGTAHTHPTTGKSVDVHGWVLYNTPRHSSACTYTLTSAIQAVISTSSRQKLPGTINRAAHQPSLNISSTLMMPKGADNTTACTGTSTPMVMP